MAAILIPGSNQTLFKYLCQDLQGICYIQDKTLKKLSKKSEKIV